MIKTLPARFRNLPTPMAGLALGVASLGVCFELALDVGDIAPERFWDKRETVLRELIAAGTQIRGGRQL